MEQLLFSDKATTEVIAISVNFADRLQYGESVNGATVAIVVASGVDPTPAAMLVSPATYTTTTVTQELTGGVAGVTYTLIYLATGSNSHNYAKQGYLAVVAPGTF